MPNEQLQAQIEYKYGTNILKKAEIHHVLLQM